MEYLNTFNGLNYISLLYHEIDKKRAVPLERSQVPGYYTYYTDDIFGILFNVLFPMLYANKFAATSLMRKICLNIAEYVSFQKLTFFECLNCFKPIAVSVTCEGRGETLATFFGPGGERMYHIPPQIFAQDEDDD